MITDKSIIGRLQVDSFNPTKNEDGSSLHTDYLSSTMNSSNSSCLPSNPDVTGIGIRSAIYAQNFLSFAPAIFSLVDGEVSPTEMESLKSQSINILVTALAILFSTIAEARQTTAGLTNYHAAIVLNLSWMNNTNLFIYLLLYGYREVCSYHDLKCSWRTRGYRLVKNTVFIFGSLHLTLMSTIGLWLWSKPARFGMSKPCTLTLPISITGGQVLFDSKGLQVWSIFVYVLILVPFLNMIMPILFFAMMLLFFSRFLPAETNPLGHKSHFSIGSIGIGLSMLAITDIIFLLDTEVTLRKNSHVTDQGDSMWSFGQLLALFILLVPLRDIFLSISERKAKRYGDELIKEAGLGNLSSVKYIAKLGPKKASYGEFTDVCWTKLILGNFRICTLRCSSRKSCECCQVSDW